MSQVNHQLESVYYFRTDRGSTKNLLLSLIRKFLDLRIGPIGFHGTRDKTFLAKGYRIIYNFSQDMRFKQSGRPTRYGKGPKNSETQAQALLSASFDFSRVYQNKDVRAMSGMRDEREKGQRQRPWLNILRNT